MTLVGNKYVNHTMFKPHLYIYDDLMIYKRRRKLIYQDEITINYNHIVNVYVHKGLVFSKFEIVMAGAHKPVTIKGIWNKQARKAKNFMDKKIYQVHNKQELFDKPRAHSAKQIDNFEMSLNRLKELLNQGRISQKEYNKKKKDLLKGM